MGIPLALEAEPLRRITTHLVLHALEHTTAGGLAVVLKEVDLGGRRFGLLYVQETKGRKNNPKTLFGLGWLRQSVLEVGGLLELDQDPLGGLRPRIYLPTPAMEGMPPTHPESKLAGRLIWVVDRDPLVREGLMSLIQMAGGRAATFEDLSVLLRNSHGQPPPDVLVFERTARLERFQRAMRTFQKQPVPTLVLGMGQPLPLNPGSLGLKRLGFLEKPFPAEAFTESLLALLRQPDGPDPGLL
jgi:hypothetical protein